MGVKDLTGQRFTRLQVMSRAESDGNGNARWHCQCDCGNKTISSGFTLRNGEAKSCGCLRAQRTGERFRTHGKSGSPEYRTWADIHQRCENANTVEYERYGGRGIKVCETWADFDRFYADMGPKPSPKHTIERRDNDKGYGPDNCHWATWKEQQNNKSNNRKVIYKGKTMPLMDAVAMAGNVIGLRGAWSRIERGWSIEDTVETPASPRHFHWKRGYRDTY